MNTVKEIANLLESLGFEVKSGSKSFEAEHNLFFISGRSVKTEVRLQFSPMGTHEFMPYTIRSLDDFIDIYNGVVDEMIESTPPKATTIQRNPRRRY